MGEPLADTAEQIESVKAAALAAGRTDLPTFQVAFRPILGTTDAAAWEKAHRIVAAISARKQAAQPLLGRRYTGTPENTGSQRLIAVAERGDRFDRALWTATAAVTDGAGNSNALVGTPETVAEALLDYYDLGIEILSARGYDILEDAIEFGRDVIPIVRAEVASVTGNGRESLRARSPPAPRDHRTAVRPRPRARRQWVGRRRRAPQHARPRPPRRGGRLPAVLDRRTPSKPGGRRHVDADRDPPRRRRHDHHSCRFGGGTTRAPDAFGRRAVSGLIDALHPGRIDLGLPLHVPTAEDHRQRATDGSPSPDAVIPPGAPKEAFSCRRVSLARLLKSPRFAMIAGFSSSPAP